MIIRYPRLAGFSRNGRPSTCSCGRQAAFPQTPFVDRGRSRPPSSSSAPSTELVPPERGRALDGLARLLGNFHAEMTRIPKETVDKLCAAELVTPSTPSSARRSELLQTALERASCTLLRVPATLLADQASDLIVAHAARSDPGPGPRLMAGHDGVPTSRCPPPSTSPSSSRRATPRASSMSPSRPSPPRGPASSSSSTAVQRRHPRHAPAPRRPVLSDGGTGLPRARMIGAEAATSRDARPDRRRRVLPAGALRGAARRARGRRLRRPAGRAGQRVRPGLLGPRARPPPPHEPLKGWFGARRDRLRPRRVPAHGLDDRFLDPARTSTSATASSGPVADRRLRPHRRRAPLRRHLRLRARPVHPGRRGARADGARAPRPRAALAGLPAAAAARGIGLTIARREPRFVPYYLTYAVLNYAGMVKGLRDHGLRGAGA